MLSKGFLVDGIITTNFKQNFKTFVPKSRTASISLVHEFMGEATPPLNSLLPYSLRSLSYHDRSRLASALYSILSHHTSLIHSNVQQVAECSKVHRVRQKAENIGEGDACNTPPPLKCEETNDSENVRLARLNMHAIMVFVQTSINAQQNKCPNIHRQI